jgi:hypothetical protein
MALDNIRRVEAYGIEQALQRVFPAPIVSRRNPTRNDRAPLGQVWINTAANTVYTLSSIADNHATWGIGATTAVGNFAAGGTVTAGTGLIATAGGVTATGNVTITNGVIRTTAGNVQTDAGNIVSVLGNITAQQGDVEIDNGELVITTAATGITLPGGLRIITGAGAPAVVAPNGSIYLRTDGGAAHNTTLYVRVNGAWEVVTSA